MDSKTDQPQTMNKPTWIQTADKHSSKQANTQCQQHLLQLVKLQIFSARLRQGWDLVKCAFTTALCNFRQLYIVGLKQDSQYVSQFNILPYTVQAATLDMHYVDAEQSDQGCRKCYFPPLCTCVCNKSASSQHFQALALIPNHCQNMRRKLDCPGSGPGIIFNRNNLRRNGKRSSRNYFSATLNQR